MSNHSAFDDALERIIVDRTPRDELAALEADEEQMVAFAQLLRGSAGQAPDPAFRARLYEEVSPPVRRLSRRSTFLAAMGAMAAGLLGGIGLDRFFANIVKGTGTRTAAPRWTEVARVEDIPSGAVQTFTVGEVPGVLINRQGTFTALSRVCTHMGCAVRFQPASADLQCPCHGARFDVTGQYIPSAHSPYAAGLPPLPHMVVRVRNGAIEIWSA